MAGISIHQASLKTGRDKEWLRKLVRSGEIERAGWDGNRVLVDSDSLDAYIERVNKKVQEAVDRTAATV